MTRPRQHAAKTSKGPQQPAKDGSRAADTGSAAERTPPKARGPRRPPSPQR